MRTLSKLSCLCIVFDAILLLQSTACAAERSGLLIGGSWSGLKSQEVIGEEFQRVHGVHVGVRGSQNERGFQYLAEGKYDVLMYSPVPGVTVEQALTKAFSNPDGLPSRYTAGQFVVEIMVHKTNLVPALTLAQLKGIFTGATTDWKDVGGRPGQIVLFGEGPYTKSNELMMNLVTGRRRLAGAMTRYANFEAVSIAVGKEPRAIGFALSRHKPAEPARFMSIKVGNGTVDPSKANVFEKRYPLTEDLFLFVSPTASDAAIRYCEFATGPSAAAVVSKWFLYPQYEREQHFVKKRIEQAKAGKGVVVSATGHDIGRSILEHSALVYTKSTAPTVVVYSPAPELSAVGRFLGATTEAELVERPDVLVLNGAMSSRCSEVYGTHWSRYWGAERSGRPEGFILGSKAVVVVVNSVNPLEALKVEQLKELFASKATNWKLFSGIDAEMRRYGPPATDPAARLFQQQVLAGAPWGAMYRKVTDKSIISALSLDPQGVAILDFTAIDPKNRSLKPIGIMTNAGIVKPDIQSIQSGRYPLVAQVRMYVSREAQPAVRSFAQFIIGAGGTDMIRQAGLVPYPPQSVDEGGPSTARPATRPAGARD